LPAKKFTGISLFLQEASANKPIQVNQQWSPRARKH
jgi:hypothetical protein